MSNLEERYKTCGRCAHDGESHDIPETECYMCKRNPTDNRIDWFEEKKDKKKIILEGRILLFDQINKNRDIFPKDCRIDIPEKVPLLWDFNHGSVIGIAEVTRDEKGLIARAELFPGNFIGIDDFASMFTEEKIGVGGFYNRIKKHEIDSFIVVDECTLREVSLTLAPVHEEYYLEIVEEFDA